VSTAPGDLTWLVVGLKSEDGQVLQIVEILRQLEIPARVVAHAALAERRQDVDARVAGALDRAPSAGLHQVMLSVPTDRVVTAVLALEHHGFTQLRAYGGSAPDGLP
jgi:hypothetical protein